MSNGYKGEWDGLLAVGGGCTKHAEAIRVWALREPVCEVYAGGQQYTDAPAGATLVDLAGGYDPRVKTYGDIEIPGLMLPRVCITWADGGTPGLADWQWAAIAKALRAKAKVYVSCQAGHGRTGTALAILAHFMGMLPEAGCPVTWVRERYCDEAVETNAQLDYVEKITGRKVQVVGSYAVANVARYGARYAYNHTGPCPDDCKWGPEHTSCHRMGHEPKVGATIVTKGSTTATSAGHMGLAGPGGMCVAQTWDDAYPCSEADELAYAGLHKCALQAGHVVDHVCACGYEWEPWSPNKGKGAAPSPPPVNPQPTRARTFYPGGCEAKAQHKGGNTDHVHGCDYAPGHLTLADRSLEASFHHCPGCKAHWSGPVAPVVTTSNDNPTIGGMWSHE